ncbi:FG-GAP-like repeat-containing protein [Candidatus Palauibacter sp.]|uniref:FG-GAP-like repeat-containing protein n=1 Tax=Candidatus Palauibacter sp. TaxID=3101350 RepID=UPI003B0247EF
MTNRRNPALGGFLSGTALVVCAAACRDPVTPPDPVPEPLPLVAVQSLSPAPNALAVPRDAELLITFDRPLDDARLDALDVRVFGRWSGVAEVTVHADEQRRTLRIRTAKAFAAGEEVTATLVAGSYGGAAGEFGLGHTWSFRTASSRGSFAQRGIATLPVRRPGEAHIQTYGAYAGDLNGDGWSDLILPNERSVDIRIFLNDGTGGYSDFAIVPVPGGVDPSTNEGADLDGDGDIDLVVGNARGSLAAVFFGDGAGGMAHVQNLEVGEGVRGVCLIDFENDGDADLVATAFGADRVALFRNSGGTFARVGTVDVGDGEWSCAPGDVNGDGLMDVFIGTRRSDEVVTLVSRGDGTFETMGRIASGDAWMLASGDLDGDGRIDAAAVNGAAASLSILRGGGDGTLSLAGELPLDGFPLAIDAGDLDGDGDLEILASDFDSGRFVIFENLGGSFERRPESLAARTAASCAILHDRDNDGDLDITGIDEIDDLLFLFENVGG